MNNSEIEKYKVTPEGLIELLNKVNSDGGFEVPDKILIARSEHMRNCLSKLGSESPSDEFSKDLNATLTKLEHNANNIELHMQELGRLSIQFGDFTNHLITSCKDSFSIAMTTLKIFQLKATK